MICFDSVSFSYRVKQRRYDVFKNLSFDIGRNEFFCIIGPSGCGKTTLIKNVAGFEKPTSGDITFNDEPIRTINYKRAMVFQEDAVFPWLSVRGNIEYGLRVRGVPAAERQATVDRYVEMVGLRGFEKAWPKELSGGMRKRVDLARVLANDPEVLLMDEPFGALDAMTKESLQEKLVEIWEQSRKTIFFITHDIEEALFLGDRVAVMQKMANGGEFKIFDVPFTRPRDIYVKEDPEFQEMRRMLVREFKRFEHDPAAVSVKRWSE